VLLSSVTDRSRYKRYQRAGAAVEGWFSETSAALFDAFLCFQAARGTRGDFMEIGVFHGKAALLLALHAGEGDVIRLLDVSDAAIASTSGLLRQHVGNEIQAVLGPSEAASLDLFPSRSTRLMHIDGDHGLWALHNDLMIADRVMGPDGVVVLDDFFAPQFIGVTIGAIQWLSLHPQSFEMILVGFNKAYLVRPRVALEYHTFMRDLLPGFLRFCGISDFTLSRTDIPRACATFGITGREYDLDILTRERMRGMPEALVEGKIVL